MNHDHTVGDGMKPADTRIFSVIVKIWIEDAGRKTWHGRLTHVPSGQQWSVGQVADIARIITSYLAAYGYKPDIMTQVRRWMQRLKPQ